MAKYLSAYLAAAMVMVAIDLVWLGVVAQSFYRAGLGHLMADEINVIAAVAFYLMFPIGLVIFAVAPNAPDRLVNVEAPRLKQTFISGALFGLFTYATYDLTNLATLKNWPIGLALLDIVWGTLVSGISATAGGWVLWRRSMKRA